MDAAALLRRWYELPAATRRLVCAALACVMLIVAAAEIFAHPQRSALYAAALHPEQLAEVQDRLAAWNVPFTPVSDNVLVDSKHRSELLLRLSLAGVPHEHVDGTGDVLGKVGALTPQAVIDAQTRDGLAGDIELALRGIDGVQDARVIIAPAKEGFFAGDASHPASASVRITSAGPGLSPEAVDGIRAFVAASVAGLEARNVTILDDRGQALDRGAPQSASDQLQRSLQSALDAALGAGAAIVRVHVEYDARAVESRDTKRTPLSAIPIASTTQAERYDGGGKRYDRSSQEVDRGSETRETSSSAQAGRIARITAAVFLDAQRIADVEQVKTLAAAAIGIDPARGDLLQVAAMPFSRETPPRKDAWWLAYGAVVPLLPALAFAGALVAAVRISVPHVAAIAANALDRMTIARTAAAAPRLAPASVRDSLAHEPPHTAAAIISALPAATAAAVLELYPESERAAIVRRMHRPASPLLGDPERFVVRG